MGAQRRASGGAEGDYRVLCSQYPAHSGKTCVQFSSCFLGHLFFCTMSNKFLIDKGLQDGLQDNT